MCTRVAVCEAQPTTYKFSSLIYLTDSLNVMTLTQPNSNQILTRKQVLNGSNHTDPELREYKVITCTHQSRPGGPRFAYRVTVCILRLLHDESLVALPSEYY